MVQSFPKAEEVLKSFGIAAGDAAQSRGAGASPASPTLESRSPIDGATLAHIPASSVSEVESLIAAAHEAFLQWRKIPAPRRGEFVRRVGDAFRRRKADLAALVTLEVGKIPSEAAGEVQEVIDICDFAVGLSRQLYGLTIASERPMHRMMEQWHPLGAIGVITAFNFPVAVWGWNAMLAWVCGDAVVWKPSEKASLCAMACQRIVEEVIRESGDVPEAISRLVIGRSDVGQAIAQSEKLPLVSATGSVKMGRAVAETVGRRLGRSLLELGGNNGMILAPSADLELAIRAITFAACGTAGQRCTTLRRLIVHESIRRKVVDRLAAIFEKLKVGDPREDGVLIGPLIDERAADAMERALEQARASGGIVRGGERVTSGVPAGGAYVRPALVEMARPARIVCEETFAPILYVMPYKELDEAIALHNAVPQGLSSAIFTADVREAERFLSAEGSDCGIANVNIGTSGAEIGGAFGGEKWTGGGRESGSDAWKNYMRRATNTINYSSDLPLAQGVRFDV
jgi:aldehyde dehydrogenase (NAD+)